MLGSALALRKFLAGSQKRKLFFGRAGIIQESKVWQGWQRVNGNEMGREREVLVKPQT